MKQLQSSKERDITEYTLADFPLDGAAQAVANIVTEKHLESVGEAILIYFTHRNRYRERPHIPQINKKLEKAREHIAALTELLCESKTRDYLFGIAREYFPDAGGKQLIATVTPIFNKTPRLHALDSLEKLDKVCEAAIKKQKPGKGRPKGANSGEAIHDLLFRLYQCCESSNGGPLTLTQGNMLEKLVKVLNKPLGLGGDLSGMVIETIKKNAPKGSKPEKSK